MSDNTKVIISSQRIPRFLVREVQAKLAYVDELILKSEVKPAGDEVVLTLRKPVGSAYRKKVIKKINQLISDMAEGAFEPRLSVIEDYLDRKTLCQFDPMDELYDKREVVGEGPGFYIIGPLLSSVIDFFNHRMCAVAQHFGAKIYRFPALISPSYLQKVKYFSNFPHSLCFVSHLREDMDAIASFAEKGKIMEGKVVAPSNSYADAEAMLSPTVCHHLYMSLSNSKLPEKGLIATAEGNCFRFESSNMGSLERLWNFTMREIIFVGSSEFVKNGLQEAREIIRKILDDMCLAYKVESATDPFFIGTFREQAAYQSAFELKFEVRALLPFKQDTFAIGSYNRHQDFFGRTLNIQKSDGGFAETGCVGFGFERVALAFVSQHGINPDNWPPKLRENYQKLRQTWHTQAMPKYEGPIKF